MVDILTNNKVLECLDVVSKTLGIEKEAILGKTRDRVLVDARRIIMNIVLSEESISVSDAARSLNKNHATVIYYRSTHHYLYDSLPRYKATYDVCLKEYKGEKAITFQDYLEGNQEMIKLQDEIKKLKAVNASLRYDILKLQNKFREHNFMIPFGS
tara:strand:- start:193 stop:660 length:468 start_codon:yes stop_codon:yes gene_type:complete